MSCKNPTHGPRTVPLILSDEHREAIREDCMNGLQSVLTDLATPALVSDPAAVAIEGRSSAAFSKRWTARRSRCPTRR